MSIIVIWGKYPTDDGDTEQCVSHGINVETGNCVPLPQVSHPSQLGAKYDSVSGEWLLND